MLDEIYRAGVVGAGGAGFPTHVKYDCHAEIFLVNAVECEPLLRTDRHLVEAHAPEIVRAAAAVREHLGARRAVVAVKEHYGAAVAALKAAMDQSGLELFLADSVYPAGDEQNLVYAVTGRVVPTGGLPLDVGCVVSNVTTVYNVGLALRGVPVTERSVTVSGAVARPVTVTAPVGAPMEALLAAAGGETEQCEFIIGGPLMGRVAENLSNEVVTKTSGGLLAIPKGHTLLERKRNDLRREAYIARAVCCQCSRCTQMCPRNALGLNVQPHRIMRALAYGDCAPAIGDSNGVFSCCDCGVCTYYACGFGLHPSIVMQAYKADLIKNGVRAVKEVKYEARDFETTRLPTERLLQRLDLKRFDAEAPFGGAVDAKAVRIPLKMHTGAPCRPVVSAGDRVNKGDPIAEPDGLGARIHASIAGTVFRVDSQSIEIRR